MAMKYAPNDPCPCQSGRKYKKCCRPYHSGQHAPTPEALLRSRFAAYALNNADYIMETTHPESPNYIKDEKRWRARIEAFMLWNRFVGLDIVSMDEAIITYDATVRMLSGEDNSYTEQAEFRQHNGRWYYYDGEVEQKRDSETENSTP